MGWLNYVSNVFSQLSNLIQPLHDHLKKIHFAWIDDHTRIIRSVKNQVKCLPCLHILDHFAYEVVEMDAFDIRYGGILKQAKDDKE